MKLEELINEHEDTLLRIKTRLYFLIEVEKQLNLVTQKKAFKIKNDIVYRMIFDTWDMLVIDFASLAKGMLGEGGLFNQMKANLHEIKPLSKKKVEVPTGSIRFVNRQPDEAELKRIQIELANDFVKRMIEGNREALFSLFPKAKDRNPIKVRSEDIDELKNEFEKIITDVVDDRNKHRAHKFEKIQDKVAYEKLDFTKLNERFDHVEQLMNKIRMVVCNSSFGYGDMNMANKTEVAKDLVSMVLWGSNKMIDMSSGINEEMNKEKVHPMDRVYGWMLREKMVTDSHGFHTRIMTGDLRPKDAKEDEGENFCFNDVSLETMRQRGTT